MWRTKEEGERERLGGLVETEGEVKGSVDRKSHVEKEGEGTGRRMRQQNSIVEQVFHRVLKCKRRSAAVECCRKGFWEIACRNHHETNRDWNSLSKRFGSRYTEVISFRFLGSCKELRWAQLCKSSLPPCSGIGNKSTGPFGTGVDGHTHAHTRTRANKKCAKHETSSWLMCSQRTAESPLNRFHRPAGQRDTKQWCRKSKLELTSLIS